MATIGKHEAFHTKNSFILITLNDDTKYLIHNTHLHLFFESTIYFRKIHKLLDTYWKEKKNIIDSSIPNHNKDSIPVTNKIHGVFDVNSQQEWPANLKFLWNHTQKYLKKPRFPTNTRRELLPKEYIKDQEGYYRKSFAEGKNFKFYPDPFVPKSGIISFLYFLIFICLFVAAIVFFGDIFGFVEYATETTSPIPVILLFLSWAFSLGLIIAILSLISYYIRFSGKKQRFITIGPEGVIFKLHEKKTVVYFSWENVNTVEKIIDIPRDEYMEKYSSIHHKDVIRVSSDESFKVSDY